MVSINDQKILEGHQFERAVSIAKQSRMHGALRWSFSLPRQMSDVSALFGILSTFNL